jgi:regulator of sigma E protease
MDTLFNAVLPFAGILIFLIVMHELGHFISAKLLGVKVLEAGIGYPPRAWGFTWHGTIYSLNWLPLGGFVRLLGEEDPTDPQSLAAQRAWKRLVILGAGSGMNFILPIILFAIAFMIPRDVNVGLTQINSVVQGAPAASAQPLNIPDGLDPEEAIGLRSGDIIYAVNDRETRNTGEVGREIRLNLGETITVTVRRVLDSGERVFIDYRMEARWAPPDIVHVVEPGESVTSVAALLGIPAGNVREAGDIDTQLTEGQQLTIADGADTIVYEVLPDDTVAGVALSLGVGQEAVRLAAGLPDPDVLTTGGELRFAQGPTGITISTWNPAFLVKESFPPWEAVAKGWTSTIDALILARKQVETLFHGGSGPDVAGPVGIAQATGEVVDRSGWQTLLDFAALLSINLAIINILPLPMLDGGRIVFVLLEVARRGKRIAPQKEAIVHLVGLAAILTLALVITYFDVIRVIRGDSLFR